MSAMPVDFSWSGLQYVESLDGRVQPLVPYFLVSTTQGLT